MIDGNGPTGLGNGYLKHVLEFYNRMASLYDLVAKTIDLKFDV